LLSSDGKLLLLKLSGKYFGRRVAPTTEITVISSRPYSNSAVDKPALPVCYAFVANRHRHTYRQLALTPTVVLAVIATIER
jgi:hypothetical protein